MAIIARSFPIDVDCSIIATATYSLQQIGTATDWGSDTPGTRMQLRRVADFAILATGVVQPCTRTRMSQIYRAVFDCLAANGEQYVELQGVGGAPGTGITYWDIDLTVEVIKR